MTAFSPICTATGRSPLLTYLLDCDVTETYNLSGIGDN